MRIFSEYEGVVFWGQDVSPRRVGYFSFLGAVYPAGVPHDHGVALVIGDVISETTPPQTGQGSLTFRPFANFPFPTSFHFSCYHLRKQPPERGACKANFVKNFPDS